MTTVVEGNLKSLKFSQIHYSVRNSTWHLKCGKNGVNQRSASMASVYVLESLCYSFPSFLNPIISTPGPPFLLGKRNEGYKISE